MPHATPTPDDLRTSLIDRFRMAATTPASERKFPVGPESASRLGHDDAEIDALPTSVTDYFCGVGDPFSPGQPQSGEMVLDLGCGAGFDTLLDARRVGQTGRVIGIDRTPEMAATARRNADRLGSSNVEIVLGETERLPLCDASMDLVISNGVFNLCPDKPRVLAEVFPVLTPGGRLQVDDILLHEDVTPEDVAGEGRWSD
ncbi:MAG TPA: methyltransferase domain-containing protein [Isosphaeraceae bacterium]|nr:methyltransferase domain-containing protein [Isosphaeraceae bacterium]